MEKTFWNTLNKPIVGLSPMDGVTDAPMRFIAKKYGQPDVIYTEFVSVEGLWRIKKRGEDTHKIWNELKFDKSEHPVVAQLFGSDPDSFYEATKIVASMGFDGIDINMGCPSPGLEKRGGGAGLMRDPGLAHRVIEATRKAVNDVGMDVPVSVKTRIGSSRPDADWWKALAREELPLVAMHGRTFKQLYSGEADWEVLREASKIIKESGALFLGNGDVEGITGLPHREYEISAKGGLTRNDERSEIATPRLWRDRNDESVGSGMTGTGLPHHEYMVRNDERSEIAAPRLWRDRNDESVGSGMTGTGLPHHEYMVRNDEYTGPGMTRAVLSNGNEIELGTDFDGVLVGRKAIGNPWALRKDGQEPSVEEKLKVAVEHARKFEELFCNDLYRSRNRSGMTETGLPHHEYVVRNDENIMPGMTRGKFEIMRKHLTWYAHGFDGAGGLRRQLVQTNSADEVEGIVTEFLESYT